MLVIELNCLAEFEIKLELPFTKLIMPFDTYPNDPNFGFYLYPAYLPQYDEYSRTGLVKNVEPDFSMPFNANAISHAIIGFGVVNLFYALVKAKRFI